MSNNKSYGWWELFKFIIDFFRGRRRIKEEKDKERLRKINEELQKDYDRINKEKESNKNKSLEDRLNNMF